MLDDAEKKAFEKIHEAYQAILDLGLECNREELVLHIHGLQMFPMQRALHRASPDEFNGGWFKYE